MPRVYLPTTLAGLAGLVAAGGLTPDADRVAAEGTEEESEYAALMTAADASAALLDGPGRRVVVVAEIADPDGPVPLRSVVAVHADPAPYVDPDDDLAWYATQEIEHLLDGGG